MSDKITLQEHPDGLLMPYVEGLLDPPVRTAVDTHLDTCTECAEKLKELERLATSLNRNRDAFCPEPWELFAFCEDPANPAKGIAEHVDQCPLCRADAAEFQARTREEPLPEKVRTAVEFHYPQGVGEQAADENRSGWLKDLFAPLFRVRAPLLGAAMAAILVAVIVYPTAKLEQTMGLSSLTWENGKAGLVPKSMSYDSRPRVAMLVMLRDFRQPLSQEEIDSLYRALKPTPEMQRSLDVLAPAVVKSAVGTDEFEPNDREGILERLDDDFDLARLLIVTLTGPRSRVVIENEVIEPKTKRTIAKGKVEAVSENGLTARLRDSALSLLKIHSGNLP
ncbi:zf-HC2 domain-containing protein [Thermodesulfobacteriota bacterium]